MKNSGDKSVGFVKSYGKDICVSVLFLISAGAIIWLAWNSVKKGQQIDLLSARINEMEKRNNALIANYEVLQNEVSKTEHDLGMVNTRFDAFENQTNTLGLKIDVLKTTLSEIDLLSSKESTRNDALTVPQYKSTTTVTKSSSSQEAALTSPIVSPSTTTIPNAFQVLKTNETVYKNYSFLAVQVTVPGNRRSVSENWCRDYENLCKQFGRRPTGCDNVQVSGDSYKNCATTYGSDMNIGQVLGCPPTYGIALLISETFPTWTPKPLGGQNSFGFFQCDDVKCQNVLTYSDFALYGVADVLKKNILTVYTVCR